MEAMKSMEPLKPMEPMQEMPPLANGVTWWPEEFGTPSTAGSQNDLRYAFFPQKRRLVIERHRELAIYDSGGHDIDGVSQSDGHERVLSFTSSGRDVALDTLRRLA